MAKLLLLFTVVPFVELYLLLLIDEQISFWPTVGLVLTTGVIGAFLARYEGTRVLKQWRKAMLRGHMPEEGVIGGLLVLIGGLLLVMPGVLTDSVGLFLLIPPTRRLVANWVRRRIDQQMQTGQIQVVSYAEHVGYRDDLPNGGWDGVRRHPNVGADMEAEFYERDDEEEDLPPPDRLLH